jgi:iron complex outermembrane receptor protein
VYVPLGLSGDDGLRAEKLLAWEAGYRVQLGERWILDTSLFYNDYGRLIGVPPGVIGRFTDAASGATWGGELSASAQLAPDWKLEGSYSRLQTRIDGPVLPYEETGTPKELAQLRSYYDISADLELNAAVYHVGEAAFNGIPAYTRADLGITWRPRPGMELSAWGQNLLDASHREASAAEVPRGVYLQVAFDLAH